ncbi:MAG TPA: hypothetical protein VHX37_16085 [Acidobacteriaceae bacterium]|jgi:hypothetical protein|nr:hypothetical protein [Acidobacteriaceae bacterium]
MKLFSISAVAVLGASFAFAQQSQPANPPGTPAARPQVLFSGPPKNATDRSAESAPDSLTDAQRRAVVITAWDLDIHLTPRDQGLEAHARITLRNDGSAPLSAIPLQLSSTLHFESIGLRGRPGAFTQSMIASDADHTGHLNESDLSLPAPLAPGSSLTLDVNYGGAIPLSADRLTAIGAPQAAAEASDWDRISSDLTALRGFGNVVWYPVSSVPVKLDNGATLVSEIGRQKLNDQDATVSLRLTDEFFSEPPTAVILDGHFVPLGKPTAMPTAAFPGVITAALPATRLGFEAPSLFLTNLTETEGKGLRVFSSATDVPSAQRYVAAAALAQSLIESWLGNKPHPPLTVLALPEPGDAAAEAGDLLATPLSTDEASYLAPQLIHSLAHAAFHSPRAWLDEGVATFLNTLWIEENQGHVAAMENLNAGRPALAIAEPATPGIGAGPDSSQDLLHAVSPVYYRTKAAYVLWMLRSVAGDKPLQTALQAYDPAQDTTPGYFEHLLEKASGRDLHGFFQDWVDEDRGLPDLSIGGVYPTPEGHQQFLVAVDLINNGYAEADVPLTIKGEDASLTDWVRVPARTRISHRMMLREMPTEVDLNDGSVPEVQDSIHQKLINEAPPTE